MASSSKTRMKLIHLGLLLILVAWCIPTASSEAVPAFARKYDLSCTSCHTKPPRLNPFGEAFNMSGFNIPATTKGGEVKKKRKIGRVRLERSLANIIAVRIVGNFVEYVKNRDITEANLVFPHEIELFIAGTLTNEISYFFELDTENPKIEGSDEEDGKFVLEDATELSLGRSFLVFNLGQLVMGGGGSNPFRIGPMLRIGNLDPSTFFSFPFERQYFKAVPGRVDKDGNLKRATLPAPLALGSKFFGVETGGGVPIEVTEQILFNGEGFGVDLHALLGNFILQVGIQQGIMAGVRDENAKKDPYVMGRYNFGWEEFISGNISGFANWGNDTARVDNQLVDWFRYGFGANIKISHVDIYGAFIWDEIKELPSSAVGRFDEKANGFTIEGDYIAFDHLMLMLKYDILHAGGFLDQKADGEIISLQARYYIRDNLGIYISGTQNLAGVSNNPLRSFRNIILLGVDFDW